MGRITRRAELLIGVGIVAAGALLALSCQPSSMADRPL
jgi:hypothetical protein